MKNLKLEYGGLDLDTKKKKIQFSTIKFWVNEKVDMKNLYIKDSFVETINVTPLSWGSR